MKKRLGDPICVGFSWLPFSSHKNGNLKQRYMTSTERVTFFFSPGRMKRFRHTECRQLEDFEDFVKTSKNWVLVTPGGNFFSITKPVVKILSILALQPMHTSCSPWTSHTFVSFSEFK